jgi:hypothetical protein
LPLNGSLVEGWGVGLLFIDDVEIKLKLVDIDGISGDDVVEMFPVVEEDVVGGVEGQDRFLYEGFEGLNKFLLCHFAINYFNYLSTQFNTPFLIFIIFNSNLIYINSHFN